MGLDEKRKYKGDHYLMLVLEDDWYKRNWMCSYISNDVLFKFIEEHLKEFDCSSEFPNLYYRKGKSIMFTFTVCAIGGTRFSILKYGIFYN